MTQPTPHSFFTLTPDQVLNAVEQSGHLTTGLCYPLNSLENRVYEVELDDRSRVVAKFYRPGRWSADAIGEEHALLSALIEAEIPVCAPICLPTGKSIATTSDGIFFALFPKTGGRSPEDLVPEQYEQLGRLLARIHNVSATMPLHHRGEITPATYGKACLETVLSRSEMSAGIKARYIDAVTRLITLGEAQFRDIPLHPIHGDCHRGNLLYGRTGWFFLDFDDMGTGPAVQDIWLLLPARLKDCPIELDALIDGYEQFRELDRRSLNLVEVLRALRYVRYAAWIAERWDDPAFQRAFPNFGTDAYWENQYADVSEQVILLEQDTDR